MTSSKTILMMMKPLLIMLGACSIGRSFSMSSTPPMTTKKTLSTPVLTPSENDDEGPVLFDTNGVANPVVLPPNKGCAEWQCYYYGNNGSWRDGKKCFLPTGSIGLAVSKDGLKWTKVAGREEGGAVLTPGPSDSWDSLHIGVGDVVRINEKELHMYYFGADDEEVSTGNGGAGLAGLRMRIGRAKSTDNGRTWEKDDGGYLLDHDDSEGFFASWPKIVTFDDDDDNNNRRPWLMFYHSYDGQKGRVYGAESTDQGDTWTRTGLVLEGDHADETALDFQAIGTRSVTKWRESMLMIYEGVNSKGAHSFGAASCKCLSTGTCRWTKLGPVLGPAQGPLGEWTKEVIGTPCVVTMPDGSLRLYHCAKSGPDDKMAIGVVVSESGDVVGPDCWTALV